MDNRPSVHLLIADGSQEDRRREGGTGGQRRAAGCRTADGVPRHRTPRLCSPGTPGQQGEPVLIG